MAMAVGATNSRQLILRSRHGDEVDRMAEAWGWQWLRVSVGVDPFEEPSSDSWGNASGRLEMTCYDDWDVRLSYVMFFGRDAGEAR